MRNGKNPPIGQIVAETPAAARVFDEYRMDYCSEGKDPLDVACRKVGAVRDRIVEEIELAARTEIPTDLQAAADRTEAALQAAQIELPAAVAQRTRLLQQRRLFADALNDHALAAIALFGSSGLVTDSVTFMPATNGIPTATN